MINLSTRRTKQLSPRERRFLRAYLGKGMRIVDAYKEAVRKPDGTVPIADATARVCGCNMLKRLRQNPALWQDILAAADLDDYSLAGHLNRMLRARKTEYYQGKALPGAADNATRMRAVELLAELLGHRKNAVELAGSLGIKTYITVSPDDWQAPDPAAETEHG